MVGLTVTGLIVWITGIIQVRNSPVNQWKLSQSGHATNIIQGLAISMQSTALPTIVIILEYFLINLLVFTVFNSATTMLALGGMIVYDAYGPVTDNAGGIV